MKLTLESTYADLPEEFARPVSPSSASAPELLAFNRPLAGELGLDVGGVDDDTLARVFSGKALPASARPVAMAYSGHQFGHFNPHLGDGRAILLGEVVTPTGQRRDLHLKGAGKTPFSRRGDGRSSLGPVIREYLVSEAMHALGVPTTRALAAMKTGETVYREDLLPGGSMVRVASSHIRVGTFEFFAARRMGEHLRRLADYAIARHDHDLVGAPDRYITFFRRVTRRKLKLVARWMGVGFIHGVMNTDNTTVSGETIDYGPCAFMDTYDEDQVYSSIDHYGRYRYSHQGRIAMWNLSVLANAFVPLVAEDTERAVEMLNEELGQLEGVFDEAWLAVMAPKLGIFEPRPEDRALVERWLTRLQREQLDFTNSFRGLATAWEAATPFHEAWRSRLDEQPQTREEAVALMKRHNPAIIPRNHQVERAIEGALAGDLSHFKAFHAALASPYEDRRSCDLFTSPPLPGEVVEQTFCGT